MRSQHIQQLRGFAVLAVVLFHANPRYFPQGFLGVDLFFIISGFLIIPIIKQIYDLPTSERLKALAAFYRRRYFRLYPALLLTIAITALVMLFFAPVGDHINFALQAVASLLFMGNFGAAKVAGDYFHPSPSPLIHTWSLGVEEQIYVVIPLLFVYSAYRVSRHRDKAFTAILTLLTDLA